MVMKECGGGGSSGSSSIPDPAQTIDELPFPAAGPAVRFLLTLRIRGREPRPEERTAVESRGGARQTTLRRRLTIAITLTGPMQEAEVAAPAAPGLFNHGGSCRLSPQRTIYC